MPGWRERIMALTILVLGAHGCSKQNGHLPQVVPPDESSRAFMVPACGAMGGGALDFYFTQQPNQSATYRATYISVTIDGNQPESGGNFIITPGTYLVSASRCGLAGDCEAANSGIVQLRSVRPGQKASGMYELGFKDGSVERAAFDAAYRSPNKPLACM